LGEPEIKHLDPSVRGQHHVVRLEVAVDHPFGVGGRQRPGDLLADRQRGDLFVAAVDRLAQVLALDQLEHQEIAGIAFEIVVDPADPRVVQLRQDPRLAQEAGARGDLEAAVRTDRLERHLALQLFVETDEKRAHPALAQAVQDLDVAHPQADPREVLFCHIRAEV
jgi:hypothetical protein